MQDASTRVTVDFGDNVEFANDQTLHAQWCPFLCYFLLGTQKKVDLNKTKFMNAHDGAQPSTANQTTFGGFMLLTDFDYDLPEDPL